MTYPWNACMKLVFNGAMGQLVLEEFEIYLDVGLCVGVLFGAIVVLRVLAFAGLWWRMRRFILLR
jgi:hypothetical protein